MTSEDTGQLAGVPSYPWWLRALPLFLFAFVVVGQIFSSRDVELGVLLAAVPALAALAYGPLGTGVISVITLVLFDTVFFTAHHSLTSKIAGVLLGVLSILIALGRTRRDAQLSTARSVAEAAQRAVLEPPPPVVGPLRCAALYRAAERGTLVGGDLYDVQDTPYGVRAIVGDVQGHGIAAIKTVADLVGTFREAVLDEPTLTAVAHRLDRRLSISAARGPAARAQAGEFFATAVLLEFAPNASVLRVVSCGHSAPLLVRGDSAKELAVDHAPPLGLGLASMARAETIALGPGDVLLAHTDGVTEARDAAGAFYPLAERVKADEPTRLVTAVWEDLSAYTPTIGDDVALLALATDAAAGNRTSLPKAS
ncbi:PP2C family protein-serine/threonine phosphatase [Streptomyces sp. NPDC004296]|uniref:PP2C family protein-serine/threonine phosphatase n=1 Tax=Streptomyces sp. NPDC004296 TaxID=3364697 RepID=UPI0036857850